MECSANKLVIKDVIKPVWATHINKAVKNANINGLIIFLVALIHAKYPKTARHLA